MVSTFSNEDKEFAKVYHWIGIVVVCIASVSLHFLYDWLGKNAVVAMFVPTNESIWEHLNLVFWPLLLWWGLGYLIFRSNKDLSFHKWITAGMSSIMISMLFIVSWYYTWTNGIGIESSIIDIGSLFIAVPIAQLTAIHIYRVVEPRQIYSILSGLLLILFIGMFIGFTFFTPDLPIFIPPN